MKFDQNEITEYLDRCRYVEGEFPSYTQFARWLLNKFNNHYKETMAEKDRKIKELENKLCEKT